MLFERNMHENDKSKRTIEKYLRDVRNFLKFLDKRELSHDVIVNYKAAIIEKYAVRSANSMIAALNYYLSFLGRKDLFVKQFKIQKSVYCPEDCELTREEYIRLVRTAKEKNNQRLSLVLETICATGIRVGELKHITVESLRKGRAVVNSKGKTRTVFLVDKLCRKLIKYAKKRRLVTGPVFVTKSGIPMDRSNIWREMKGLCRLAGVAEKKVFPHNLRHLFARMFYSMEKDIAALADVLGHSSINTTRIYIITSGAEHRRKMEKMKLIL